MNLLRPLQQVSWRSLFIVTFQWQCALRDKIRCNLFTKLYFHIYSCYFCIILTKTDMKFHTNFCYFCTINTEITRICVEITPSNF